MKKVLLVQKGVTELFQDIDAIQQDQQGNATIIPCTYDEFSLDISLKKQTIFFRHKPLDIDGIYFKSFSDHYFLTCTLALYCERNHIPFINSSNTSRLSNGKLFQALAFVYANMRIPHTIFFHREKIGSPYTRTYIENNLSYPMIVKSVSGAKGQDNYLVKSWAEVEDIMHTSAPKTQYIFQEHIPNDSDYRLLTLNYEVKAAYRRIRHDDSSHLNNVSQGADVKAVDIDSIPELAQLASTASRVMQKEICGVDIMLSTETGEPYILEANPNPGLSGPEALEQTVSFLQNISEPRVEEIHTAQKEYLYETAKTVEKYYADHSNQLGDEYFHFLTRLYLWTQDKKYLDMLLQTEFAKRYSDAESFRKYLQSILEMPLIPSAMTDPVKKSFYKKYPTVPYVAKILSETRIAHTVFGKDFRSEVYELYPKDQLEELCSTILNHSDALYVFSSQSDTINILFDYSLFMKNDEKAFDRLTLGKKALLSGPKPTYETLTRTAYFITHMIIGDSLYYSRELPCEVLAVYEELLRGVEDLIRKHYFSYKLDVKLEFLVCARILGYSSFLEEIIHSECLESISPNGEYMVDVHNRYQHKHPKGLKKSEHRNILFIMSTLPYPHPSRYKA